MKVRCRCGRVSWRISGEPIHRSYCHCTDCRAAHGAPVAVLLGFRDAEIALAGAEPATYSEIRGVERLFCARCGTPLGYRDAQLGPETYFAIGAFPVADQERLEPELHSFHARRLAWFDTTDTHPRHASRSRPRD